MQSFFWFSLSLLYLVLSCSLTNAVWMVFSLFERRESKIEKRTD